MSEGNTTIVRREDIHKLKGETDWNRVAALTDHEIEAAVQGDPDAVPVDIDWSDALLVVADKKVPISIRVDADVLSYFKAQGPGYQKRINAVLRAFMQRKRKAG